MKIVAGFVIAVLAGCSPPAHIPPDTLVVAQGAEPKSLDPQVATSLNDFRILENVYEGLVRFRSGTLEIEPSLAERWEVSPDGLSYTFQLRPDVLFHDGTPFDAEAVRYNFGRLLDPDHPEYDTGPFPLAFFFSAVEEVEAIDSLTVRFRLKEPFAPFLANLAYPTGYLVSPSAVRRFGREYGRHPVGTGPFRFGGWESHRFVKLERFEGYRAGSARLRQVVFRPIADENARLTELLAGSCDVVTEVAPDMIDYFRRRPDFEVHEKPGPHLWFLIFNTRSGPLADVRVRQAINYAIDKEGLCRDLLQGTATIAAGPVPKAFGWAFDPELQPYPHDPDRARALLREAGADGATLTLYATESGSGMLDPKAMATAIQGDLRAVGLRVTIETYEWNTFLAKVNKGLEGQADMAEMAWMTNDPDTLPYLALRTAAWPEKGGFNSGYYSNPEVDRLLDEARRSTAQAERALLYREMQRLVWQDAPWAFIASWKQNAVTSRVVSGLRLEPSFLFRLGGVGVDRGQRK